MDPALLVPILETLTPWPETAVPTVMELLVVIAAIPLGIAAVVTVLVMGPAWHRGRNV